MLGRFTEDMGPGKERGRSGNQERLKRGVTKSVNEIQKVGC